MKKNKNINEERLNLLLNKNKEGSHKFDYSKFRDCNGVLISKSNCPICELEVDFINDEWRTTKGGSIPDCLSRDDAIQVLFNKIQNTKAKLFYYQNKEKAHELIDKAFSILVKAKPLSASDSEKLDDINKNIKKCLALYWYGDDE